MDLPASEGDIFLSKINVAFARSQGILQSWMPQKHSSSATQLSKNDAYDKDSDEEDYATTGEAGIGDTTSVGDDGLSSKSQLNPASQKLLEQLLGKKAANAKLKEQKPHRSANGFDASKPMPTTSPSTPATATTVPNDSDDEEEGRAAMLTSSSRRGTRKVRDRKRPAYVTAGGSADAILDPDVEPPGPREDPATVREILGQDEEVASQKEEVEEKRPAKRKATSFMDEMLAKKKKKKGKGKKE
ncbi:hypothetical protein TI39_contig4330g00015 [Zymoseptoria brevis]|uniref:Uncharacterized protein n=1 Tax=Zymoseptoria brevis TaxID=1047168 RepID=A0A0F4G7Q4_9PEZI|nr:hypothetical protein TI39_contig4330g00015 [Zymoseptoria brevis]